MKNTSENLLSQNRFISFLEDYRKLNGYNQREFSELLHIRPNAYSSFKKSRVLMSEDSLNLILESLEKIGICYSGDTDFSYKKATEIQPGMRFGRLTVVQQNGKRKSDGCIYWECRCDCGRLTKTSSYGLRSGNSLSCGCNKEKQREAVRNYCKKNRSKISENASKNYPRTSLRIGMIEQTNLSYIKNAKVRSDNKTGVRGVTIDKKTGKYIATLTFQKEVHRLGSFDNLVDARKAREHAEAQIQDEIHRLEKELKKQIEEAQENAPRKRRRAARC